MRALRRWLATAGLVVGSVFPVAAPASPSRSATSGPWLVNFANARCLDIRGSATASGAAVIEDCDDSTGGSPTQNWHVRDTIQLDGVPYSQWENDAHMCLGVAATSVRSGAAVVQGRCSTRRDHSQFWHYAGGIGHLTNGHSGLHMGIAGSSAARGAAVVQGNFNGDDTQYWTVVS